MNIPIVITAFNRPASLSRLLGSIARANYPKNVKLVISVDGGPGSEDTARIAREFQWTAGKKEVIVHERNLGLRDHVLSCGDMAVQFGAAIILEDDLYVSPWFYEYAMAAAFFYREDKNVAGISLYSHRFNETAGFPFAPLDDGSDVFFMQVPCSWGQCWTADQWKAFRKWHSSNSETNDTTGIPPNVLRWPESSWKKIFMKYLIDTGRFFVYPLHSLTTNFGDRGAHHEKNRIFQVPIARGKRSFAFKKLRDSKAKYDAHCEMVPSCLAALNPALSGYDFAVDLYGMKSLSGIPNSYVLTSKECRKHEMSFARDMLPVEAGVVDDMRGDDIFLARRADCEDVGNFIRYRYRGNTDPGLVSYHYAMLTVPGGRGLLNKGMDLFRKIRKRNNPK